MGLKASIQDPQQRQKLWRQEPKSPKIKPHPPQIQTSQLRVTMRFLYHAPIPLLEVASMQRPSFLLPPYETPMANNPTLGQAASTQEKSEDQRGFLDSAAASSPSTIPSQPSLPVHRLQFSYDQNPSSNVVVILLLRVILHRQTLLPNYQGTVSVWRGGVDEQEYASGR